MLVVILVFLQDWRAMLVPATTVPVTIIGAFAAMAALGFTINLSTLFAIVLAIGIVVDDAIVVVEGAAHNIEKGMSGHDAAIRAMDELFGPIIGITLVLMSVFLPAAFLPGLTGRMYAQFALVIAATALLSAVNAATLKPTQSAMWLRAPGAAASSATPSTAASTRSTTASSAAMRRLIGCMAASQRRRWWRSRSCSSALPATASRACRPASCRSRTRAICSPRAIARRRLARADPEGARPGHRRSPTRPPASPRWSPSRASRCSTTARRWPMPASPTSSSSPGASAAPGEDLLSLYTGLNRSLGAIEDARTLVVPPPPIQGIGNAAGATMQIELRDSSFDLAKLQASVDALGGQCGDPVEPAAGAGLVPLRRAAIYRSRSTA